MRTTNLNAYWNGATFATEYYRLDAEPDIRKSWEADGYYAQASYQVIADTVELAVRYSEVKSTDGNASATFEKSQSQVGMNYYLQKHKAKLQADYTIVEDGLVTKKDNRFFRLQIQLYY